MRTRMKQTALAVTLSLAAALSLTQMAASDPRGGFRAGVNLDTDDPFVGGELLAPMGGSWWANPNLEYTFGDAVNVVGFNADFHYDIGTSGETMFWVGPGLAVLVRDHEHPAVDTETDVGLNGIMGVGWRLDSGVIPYVQGKVVLADDSEGALGFGLRF